jgi:hypothetical protein
MTNNRRSFIKQAAVLTGAFSATSLFNQAHAADWTSALNRVSRLTPQEVRRTRIFGELSSGRTR